MKPEKRKQLFLIGIFLAILLAEGVTHTTMDLMKNQRPVVADLFLQVPSQENLRNYEENLEEGSWLVQNLRPVMQVLRFAVLGDLGKKAVAGREGWLFYDLGIQYLTERSQPVRPGESTPDEVVEAIVSFRDRLAERGIHLLVVPAPGKASVYPEMLTARALNLDHPVNVRTLQLLEQLENEAIELVNLFDLYQSEKNKDSISGPNNLYLIQDTHWSPKGMEMAAEKVANRLQELGWVEKGNTDYGLKEVPLSRHGDVIRMTQIPGIDDWYEPETIQASQVVRKESGEIYADDPHSEILVLGDSFLRIYEHDEPGSGGFVAHLARDLGKPLTSIINDGGASTLVRQELYRKPEMLAGKKVVIWEFVERDIRFGTEGWQDVPLPKDKQES
ncbi:MAG: hypothetical protein KC944_21050 [Candidatus Omnitrophica bacterium]|nr:hypothetical protein [Candidatus Omnitrophota bacterium]